RLEHPRRVETELLRSLQAVGSGLGIMFIAVDTVLGLGLLQQIDGGSHAGSGAMAGGQAATVAENWAIDARPASIALPGALRRPQLACRSHHVHQRRQN